MASGRVGGCLACGAGFKTINDCLAHVCSGEVYATAGASNTGGTVQQRTRFRHPSLGDDQYMTATGVMLTVIENDVWTYTPVVDASVRRARFQVLPGGLHD